jgi:hypothetical protein
MHTHDTAVWIHSITNLITVPIPVVPVLFPILEQKLNAKKSENKSKYMKWQPPKTEPVWLGFASRVANGDILIEWSRGWLRMQRGCVKVIISKGGDGCTQAETKPCGLVLVGPGGQRKLMQSFKLRLNFPFCSQASTMFYRNFKILKTIIYIFLYNVGKMKFLDFMTSICRYAAIAASHF